MIFTEKELLIISNALNVAISRFADNAKYLNELKHCIIAKTFIMQADECAAVRNKICDETGIIS